MMTTIPATMKYSKTHEWINEEHDGTFTVGITEHAQRLLGDMVFVDLPAVGHTLTRGAEIAVLESVKAAADVYAPVTGQVIAVNEQLQQQPELINHDPYGAGWLFKIASTDSLDHLLDATHYQQQLHEEG